MTDDTQSTLGKVWSTAAAGATSAYNWFGGHPAVALALGAFVVGWLIGKGWLF